MMFLFPRARLFGVGVEPGRIQVKYKGCARSESVPTNLYKMHMCRSLSFSISADKAVYMSGLALVTGKCDSSNGTTMSVARTGGGMVAKTMSSVASNLHLGHKGI